MTSDIRSRGIRAAEILESLANGMPQRELDQMSAEIFRASAQIMRLLVEQIPSPQPKLRVVK